MRFIVTFFTFLFFLSCDNGPSTPNIIIIVFEESPFSYSPTTGYDYIDGSVFKKIAEEGVEFKNAFTASPHLAVYKQSLMSGLHTGHLLSKSFDSKTLQHLEETFSTKNYEINQHTNLSTWKNHTSTDISFLDVIWITDGTFPIIEARVRNIVEQIPDHTLLIITAASGSGKKFSEENLLVPLLLHLPEKTPAGTSTAQPIYTPDLLPTLAAFLQTNQLPTQLDGKSVHHYAIRPDTPIDDRILYWTSTGDQPTEIVRFNQWKMVKLYGSSEWRLYDMITDPSETDNVAAYHPGKFQKFQEWVAKNR